MKKLEFVKIIQKVKRGGADVYDGVILERHKRFVKAMVQGPSQDSKIRSDEFLLSEYSIEPVDQEVVKSYWNHALVAAERKLVGLEFDVEDAKLERDRQKATFKKYFKEAP